MIVTFEMVLSSIFLEKILWQPLQKCKFLKNTFFLLLKKRAKLKCTVKLSCRIFLVRLFTNKGLLVYVRLGQVRLGQVRLGQVRIRWSSVGLRFYLVGWANLGFSRLFLALMVYDRLDQDVLIRARGCQAVLNCAKLCQASQGCVGRGWAKQG